MKASSKQIKTDAENANLLGPLKQVKQICYKARKKSYQVVKGNLEDSDTLAENNWADIW